MKLSIIRRGISVALSATMLVGSPLLGGETAEVRSADYRLEQDGVLSGSVLNLNGQPVSGLPVEILHENRRIAVAMSDEAGHFAVEGLRNGQHVVKLGATQQAARFWNNATAPPTAQGNLAMTVDEEVVRSQCSNIETGDECCRGQGGPVWGTAIGVLIVGGAVAGTIVFTQRDDKPADAARAGSATLDFASP
jgi:hypothetical protein